VDTETDPANCGGCGVKCAQGQSCISPAVGMPGKCVTPSGTTPCPPTYTDCGGGSCVLTSFMNGDPLNCGACGKVCAVNEVCTMQGQCATYVASPACTGCPCAACAPGTTCCEMGGVPLCVTGSECGF
jgi:hypothetical protein